MAVLAEPMPPRQRPPKRTDEPFPTALRDLMDRDDLTYRMLADLTVRIDGRGVGHAHLNMIVRGHEKPTVRVMELVAEAFRVKPTYFAEYRMMLARDELDPERAGFERAVRALKRWEGEEKR